jgi:hypothetical protein
MSITSLNKISVYPSDGANTAMLMPKLKYRFRVTLLNFGASLSTELTKQVMDVARPTVNFEEIEVPIYNSRVYLAGRHSWEAVTLNVRDDATGAVQKLVGEQLQKQFDFMEQASAASGVDYKFTTKIEILDGGNGANAPAILETFELYGCFVQNANYNDLNYTSNEPVTIALSIRYDNAVQVPTESGIGVSLVRAIGTASAVGG